ncbi:MAG: adenylyl-sulfate kinase [Magnetovibrionaceae bacterium]
MLVRQDLAPPLRVVFVGHVDHGKSTVVGRLFNDTGSIPDGKVDAIQAMCTKRGMPFEWAFVMDALKAERDQGITIDTSQVFFKTKARHYVMIDAPGHKEFLKNMITGAAQADAALLVVDAKEGIQEQTRRHAYLLHLLGIRQVTVVVNKMDLVDWSEERFQKVSGDVQAYLDQVGLAPTRLTVIPISARDGDFIVNRTESAPWYEGPTVEEALDAKTAPVAADDLPLRLPVQDVYKFDDRRIIAGRVESGSFNVGDTLVFSPSNKRAKIASIETWPATDETFAARAGQTVGVTMDEQIFVERGQIASLEADPPMLTNVFSARIFWLAHKPLTVGERLKLKLGTAEHQVTVEAINNVIDVADLKGDAAESVERNGVGEIVLRSRSQMALDPFNANAKTGRFVLVSDYDIVGGGLISMDGYADQRGRFDVKSANITRVEHSVSPERRWQVNGHKSGVLWFTGLSGSGKSTLAFALEQELFNKGYQVYVLDGDNIRHGLSANLGFSPEDRAENIRRVGEAARLFARAGCLVLTSFISPYRADRDRVRSICGEHFHEVYVKADVDTCEKRDPKGLYKKARAGEIPEFTGISAPYETPHSPELIVDTNQQTVDEAVADLMTYVQRTFTYGGDHYSI